MRFSLKLKHDKYFTIFWIVASCLWFPLCFINFDPHHDGIILTTLNQLKLGFSNGDPWPFNQYGSAWVFPYLIFSFLVPHQYLLVTIRFVTIVFYILAAYFLFKSAELTFGKKTAKLTIFLFLALQPFIGPWNTSLLPWPSSLVLFLVSLMTFLLLKSVGGKSVKVDRNLFAIGFLVGIVLGSRIQIGILLVISISGMIFILRIGKIRRFFLGLVTWLIPFSVFLLIKGWFISSLYDSVVLGSQFLGKDHLHYPLPGLSLLAGLLVVLLIELARHRRINKQLLGLITIFIFSGTFFFAKRLLGDSFNFANYLSVTQRKLLAAIFFASVGFAIYILISNVVRHRNGIWDESKSRITVICVLGICSSVQAWPFFDQMHIWWSIAPVIAIFSHRISQSRFLENRLLRSLGVAFTLSLMTYLVHSQLTAASSELVSINQKLIYQGTDAEDRELGIQNFIRRNVPLGSKILNLCPNAYPFFIPGQYKSESRFFVYWSNFESAPIGYRDYDPKHISYVFACDTYLYQGADLTTYRLRKQRILDSIPNLDIKASMSEGAFNWKIYSTN